MWPSLTVNLLLSSPLGGRYLDVTRTHELVGSMTKYTFLSTTTYSNAYTYDANSNRASMTHPQSGVSSYVYDTLNRLSTLTSPTAFGSGLFGFTYDALSRRTQMGRAVNGHGGFGTWVADVSCHPTDIHAILARHF
jgi:YD repeat-containing protein